MRIDEADAALGKHAVHLAEPLLDQRQPRVRDERPASLDRVGVAIEADHPSRPRREHGARVAACSESAVNHRLAAVKRERGDNFTDQHRHMWGNAWPVLVMTRLALRGGNGRCP